MKKFLLQTLLFGLLLAALNGLLYQQGKALYFGNYGKVDTAATCFLLADSRGLSLNNFPADYGVANFSSNSDNYADMLRKLQYLLRHSHIKQLYISADDHLLSSYRERTNNQDISVVLTESSDYENTFQFVKERYLKYYVVLFQPVVRTIVRSKIEAWVARNFGAASSKKPIDNWSLVDSFTRTQQAQNRFILQYPDSQPSAAMVKALEQIIQLCKEHNIQLIAFRFPLTKEYLQQTDHMPFHSNEVFMKWNVPVLDHSRLYMDSSHYFKNQDHLNDLGGRVFTDHLWRNSSR